MNRGSVFTFLVFSGCLYVIASCARTRFVLLSETFRSLRLPLGVWFTASLFYVLLLYVADTGAGAWQANNRFYPPFWSSDNNWPMLVSEVVYRGNSIAGIFGDWHVSDRPQLQTGLSLLLRPLFGAFSPGQDVGHHLHYFHHGIGVLLNSFWTFCCLLLCLSVGVGRRQACVAVLFLGMTPFAIFNSVYVWPKMLAGAFGVLALIPVIVPVVRGEGRLAYRELPTVAALAAFSLLSHGAGLLFFLGLGLWLWIRVGWPDMRPLLVSCCIAGGFSHLGFSGSRLRIRPATP